MTGSEIQTQQVTTGDVNEGYEEPLPPPKNAKEYNHPTQGVPESGHTYQDLDGSQKNRVYQDLRSSTRGVPETGHTYQRRIYQDRRSAKP